MIYELHKSRLHILNFAVSHAIGGTASAANGGKIDRQTVFQRRTRIVLEVRETNLAAQLFFRASGFRAVNVLRDFYEDTTEDAYLMQFRFRGEESAIVEHERITRMAG